MGTHLRGISSLIPWSPFKGEHFMATETLEKKAASGVETPKPFRRRILLVDDQELARRNMKKILENDQFEVDTAADGKIALAKLAEQNYSLVITDLCMPHLGGLDFIQEVQKRRMPTTIIVITGHGSIDEAVKAIRMGAFDFLTKPIEVDHVRLVVDRALRERLLQDEVTQLREQLQSQYSFQNILSK